jgi:hypothetical protein
MQITDTHQGIRHVVDDAIARVVAIGALVAIALIHVLQLPEAFAAIGYLGALFTAAAAACLVMAAVLTCTSDDLAWTAAGGLSALILCGYVLSRSVGLPGFTNDTGEWSDWPPWSSRASSLSSPPSCSSAAATPHGAPSPARQSWRAPTHPGCSPVRPSAEGWATDIGRACDGHRAFARVDSRGCGPVGPCSVPW